MAAELKKQLQLILQHNFLAENAVLTSSLRSCGVVSSLFAIKSLLMLGESAELFLHFTKAIGESTAVLLSLRETLPVVLAAVVTASVLASACFDELSAVALEADAETDARLVLVGVIVVLELVEGTRDQE